MKKNEQKIKDIINKLRPFLINDGGNIEFIKYENDIVYVKMTGACSNCHMLDFTLKEGIEAAIKSVLIQNYENYEFIIIDDYSTDISDTEGCWTIKFPRSYVDVYKSSTNKTYMSFLLWNGWGSYWAIPARGNAMLEVTLP